MRTLRNSGHLSLSPILGMSYSHTSPQPSSLFLSSFSAQSHQRARDASRISWKTKEKQVNTRRGGCMIENGSLGLEK